MSKVVVDLYGSDLGHEEVLKGCYQALDKKLDLNIIVVGNENEIKELIDSRYKDRIDILHAKDKITCNDNPTTAILLKRNSSMIVGLKYLKEHNDINTFVSAGSSAALITCSFLLLEKNNLSNKIAMAPILPTINGNGVVFLDSGANINCSADDLFGFLKLGVDFYRKKFNKQNVRCAFLSNGTESIKGTHEIQEAIKLSQSLENIDLLGQIEARDVLSGKYDVVVTDGFNGNIALKSYEGMAKTIFSLLKKEIKEGGIKAKIGAFLLKPSLKKIASKLDYNKNTGGALILGLKQNVVKAHGSSTKDAITLAILGFI